MGRRQQDRLPEERQREHPVLLACLLLQPHPSFVVPGQKSPQPPGRRQLPHRRGCRGCGRFTRDRAARGCGGDRVEQGASLDHIQDRGLALPVCVLWPAYRTSSINR